MNSFLRKGAHIVNLLHECAYTYWKIRETGFQFRVQLDFIERQHFLDFRSALRGDNIVAYDIGAANGTVSSCFAKIKNVKEVHAFEPIDSAFIELQTRLKDYPQVTCHNVALGDFNGEQQMWVIQDSRDSSSILKMGQTHKNEVPGMNFSDYPIRIQMVRLDDYIREKSIPLPDVVKMDVQGYEGYVLLGGQKTISKAKYCIIELSFIKFYENGPLFDDIYRIMRNMGFQLIGVCEHIPGVSGIQLQMDGIFENQRL